jgi:hypothetical protein
MIIKDVIKPEFIKQYTKAAVDIEQERVSFDCEFHIDCAEELISSGSDNKNVWGFNIYPDGKIDFEAVYNIRPALNNRSMIIQDEAIKSKIQNIFNKFWQK